jgi:hypothetical protein
VLRAIWLALGGRRKNNPSPHPLPLAKGEARTDGSFIGRFASKVACHVLRKVDRGSIEMYASRMNARFILCVLSQGDGTNNTIVWVVGASGDQRLHGYDGDTGAVIFAGGGPNELMAGTHSYSTTGIVARGRIYVGADNKVYAFFPPFVDPTCDRACGTRPTPTPGAPGFPSRTGRD